MKATITILYTLFITTTTINGQSLQWARSVGGAASDAGFEIAVDGSGNVYITGRFEESVDFDPEEGTSSAGESDIFISKTNPNKTSRATFQSSLSVSV